MRISDWSSDVCSSDLTDACHQPIHQKGRAHHIAGLFQQQDEEEQDQNLRQEHHHRADACQDAVGQQRLDKAIRHHLRSEEHTSELQSLMRISYAVFCLKKQTKNQYKYKNHTT